MQPSIRQARPPLLERYKVRRKPALVAGNLIFGVRPVVLMAAALVLAGLLWYVYGLLTYPVSAVGP